MSSPDTEPPDMGPSPALAEGEGDISSSRDAYSNDLCTCFCFVVDVCRASTEHLFGTHRIFFCFQTEKKKIQETCTVSWEPAAAEEGGGLGEPGAGRERAPDACKSVRAASRSPELKPRRFALSSLLVERQLASSSPSIPPLLLPWD